MPRGSYERTPEIRAKNSAALIGRSTACSPGCGCRRHLGTNFGSMSAERKAKISAGVRARGANLGPKPEGFGEKIRELNLQRDYSKHRWNHPTEAHRAILSEAAKSRIAGILKRQGEHRGPTKPERQLYVLLTEAYGSEGFIAQHPVGSFVLDAYTPEDNLAWEADGDYWHRRPGIAERDERRDQSLTSELGVTAVIRLTESELEVCHRHRAV
jgi:very-short-patch-repair endonuclease